jgi:hypothetical protein
MPFFPNNQAKLEVQACLTRASGFHQPFQTDRVSHKRSNRQTLSSAAFLKSDKKRDGDDNEESWEVVPRPRAWHAH